MKCNTGLPCLLDFSADFDWRFGDPFRVNLILTDSLHADFENHFQISCYTFFSQVGLFNLNIWKGGTGLWIVDRNIKISVNLNNKIKKKFTWSSELPQRLPGSTPTCANLKCSAQHQRINIGIWYMDIWHWYIYGIWIYGRWHLNVYIIIPSYWNSLVSLGASGKPFSTSSYWPLSPSSSSSPSSRSLSSSSSKSSSLSHHIDASDPLVFGGIGETVLKGLEGHWQTQPTQLAVKLWC